MIFEQKGVENTPQVAKLAVKYAVENNLKYIVIASKTGYTTDIFLQELEHGKIDDVKLINVTHCYGDMVPGQCEMTLEKRQELQNKGVTVVTATHALSGETGRAHV